jgi:hypothetical protein
MKLLSRIHRRRDYVVTVLVLILGVLGYLLDPHEARSAELEVGVGVSYTAPPPDSLYWESGFDHSLRMAAPALSIGVRQGPFALTYHYFGKQHTDATGRQDEDAWKAGARTCDGRCMQFTGSSWIDGIAATYQLGSRWFVRGGVFVHRIHTHVDASDGEFLDHPAKWHPGGIVSAGYQWQHVSIAATVANLNTQGSAPPIPQHYVAALTVSARF